MKDAEQFKADMVGIMRQNAAKIRELREQYEDLSNRSQNTSLYGRDKIRQYQEEATAARGAMVQAIEATRDEIAAACKAYAQEVNDATALNPAELTDDVKLLNCGAPLSETDIQQMANRNKGNNTMLRLISNYAKEHDIRMLYTPFQEEREAIDYMQGAVSIIPPRSN